MSYQIWTDRGQTPASVEKQRQIAAMMLQRAGGRGRANNVGEGVGNALASIGDGLVSRTLNRRASEAEQAGMASAQTAWDSLIPGSGGSAFPSAPGSETAAEAGGVTQAQANSNPMQMASALLGKGEVPDRGVLMEYMSNGGVNLDPATTAWCAAFVNASLGQAGMQGTGSNMARSFLDWGEAVDTPQVGDLAVFSRGNPNGPFGHVGFYQGTNPDGSINVLGGNQGDKVSIAPYSASRLLGYRRAPGAGSATDAVNAMASGAPVPPQMRAQQAPDIPSWDIFPDAPTQLPAMEVPYSEDEPAQATPSGGAGPIQRLEMSGNRDIPQPNQQTGGLSVQQLMQAASNPWLSDQQRGIINTMLQREMQMQDPAYQLDMEYRRAQIDKMRNPDPSSLIHVGDGMLYNPNTGEWITAPNAGQPGFRQATPEEAAGYGAPGGQFGPDGRFYPINPPSGMTVESDGQGGFRFVQGPGAGQGDKPFTESQSKDNVYSTRARGALPTLDQYDENLARYGDKLLDSDPTGMARGWLQSEEYQVARAAGDEFLQAILRKDTGAAITSQEQELYGRLYLPQPGDSQQVLEYKRQARRRAIDAIEAGMTPAQLAAQERALQKQQEQQQEQAPPQTQPEISIPQSAVDLLIQRPDLAAEFDEKYGPGSAARILEAL